MDADPSPDTVVAELEQQLNAMLLAGEAMAAFERFYGEDVVIQENTGTPVVGKEANRKREEAFLGAIEQLLRVELVGWAARGDHSYSEWIYELLLRDGRRIRMCEVAARRWRAGQVVHERFYHNTRL